MAFPLTVAPTLACTFTFMPSRLMSDLAVPLIFEVASIVMPPLAVSLISLLDERVMPPLSILISFLCWSVRRMLLPSSLISSVFLPGVETVMTFFSSSNSMRSFSRVTIAFVLFFASNSKRGVLVHEAH